MTVSLPYEPGRPAFASLRRTADDLGALAGPRIEELPPRAEEVAHPALAHLERTLFDDSPPSAPPLEGAVRFFEGAGARAALELVGEEVLDLIRGGVEPERIALVCPSLERVRAPLETALATLGVPYALEGRVRLGPDAVRRGPAGAAALRLAGRRPARALRLPALAVLRPAARGGGLPRGPAPRPGGQRAARRRRRRRCGCATAGRCRSLELLRSAASPLAAVRALAAFDALAPRTALDARRRSAEPARHDLRAYDDGGADCSTSWRTGSRSEATLVAGGDRRGARARDGARSRARARPGASPCSTCCGRARAASRSCSCSGSSRAACRAGARPRPSWTTRRAATLDGLPRARLAQPDPVARDRYLFYTACTRAIRRLYLVREAATDEGSPREPSPFWDEARALFAPEDVARWTVRRPLSALTWPLERAPSERERLRALAALAASDRGAAEAIAQANGWERRLERALGRLPTADTPRSSPRAGGAGREADVQRHGARALRRLLVGVVRRAAARPRGRSTASPTPSCAARSRTRRCTASSPACRSRSAASA